MMAIKGLPAMVSRTHLGPSICHGTGYSACVFRTATLRVVRLRAQIVSHIKRSSVGRRLSGRVHAALRERHRSLRAAAPNLGPARASRNDWVDRLDHEGAEQASA